MSEFLLLLWQKTVVRYLVVHSRTTTNRTSLAHELNIKILTDVKNLMSL